ncbi:hypothetical protein WA026_006034 [Henosepilachna vigintioctopunctata]|uniref:Uncharacterized protein n=1 Tax=Henosepilachna vigintioctopunctata TaxID=420089 RepID=A0AAW1THS8_9CUCU
MKATIFCLLLLAIAASCHPLGIYFSSRAEPTSLPATPFGISFHSYSENLYRDGISRGTYTYIDRNGYKNVPYEVKRI